MLLTSPAFAATVDFAGVTWEVKSGTGGPGPNRWSDAADAVWVDGDGLHLRITTDGADWYSAEVYTQSCAPFGTYRFYVDAPLDTLDPNVVAAAFLYGDDLHEIDVEFSRWGDASATDDAQYVIQPYDFPGNLETFPLSLTGTYTTHSFTWSSGLVRFLSLHGHRAAPAPGYVIQRWSTRSRWVPDAADGLRVHLNLWLVGGAAPTDGAEVEVVITDLDLPALTACPS